MTSRILTCSIMLSCAALAADDSAPATKKRLKTIDEVLDAKITVAFPSVMQHDLQVIQKQVQSSYDVAIEFQITFIGKNLREGGITKNARVREFKVRDKSLADVLTAYVVFCNPRSFAKSTRDPDQVLVWVVEPDKKSILITTRRAAQAKSYELPEVFRPAESLPRDLK